MERHAVLQFGGGWRTPAVQAKEMCHGAERLVCVTWPKPAKRIQSAATRVGIHDRSTPEIDHQSGRLALESNGPAPIRHTWARVITRATNAAKPAVMS